MERHDEEEVLRSAALRNATTIVRARQPTEEELVQVKEALKRKTEELAHTLAMIRATLEATTDGILATDEAGKVTSVNQRFVEMWRIPSEIAVSQEHQKYLEYCGNQFKNPRQYHARIDDICRSSPPDTVDELELMDGRIFEQFSRIQSIDQRNVGRVWSFRDITERKRIEDAQSHLTAVVASSDDAIVSKDLDGTIRTWNEGAERIFGYTATEVVGKSITILLPPERLHEEAEILRRLRRGERIEHFDTVRVHKDGHLIDISVTISPIRNVAGRVIGASKIARDISARKREDQTTRFMADASAALAEVTDYESTLQRIASLAVPSFADWCAVDIKEANGLVRRLAFMHSATGKVELAHEMQRRYPPHPSDAFGLMKVLRTGEPEWATEMSEAVLAKIIPDPEQIGLIRALGLTSYICVPLQSRTKIIGALTFVTAESGRNYTANDLQAAEDLAHRAVIAIENASLLSTLKESDRHKDEFLAMLAHELRNPLAPIRNAVEIMRAQGSPSPEMRWAQEVIDRQVEQMTRLIDDLMDISRITRGKIDLRKERIQLATIVTAAVEANRPLTGIRGHELTVNLPLEPIFLEADPTRCAQIILNLLNNAAKYMEDGGHIWLTAERVADQAVIRVKDTGVGITPEMLPRIFDMFTQADHSLERSQGGLGIGLTLVKRLVALHGGTITAHSDGPGKGSEFVVRLPVVDVAKVAAQPSTDNTSEAINGSTKYRILVVDDNKDAADGLGKLLRMMGHQVQTSYDGSEALAAAEALRPDVVILDIGLPKLNGYQVAQRIRKEQRKHIILIAVTGWGQENDRRRSKEAGFDHHLTKPIEFANLSALLSSLELPENRL